MAPQKISLAFSPDTDDAFMVHAIEKGLIETGDFHFELIAADIQHLNEQARIGTFDITAISIAVYPLIQDAYRLVPVGSSIGDGFGPAIVVPLDSPATEPNDLKGRRLAIPGQFTSAYYAARMLIGDFEPVPTLFSDIITEVAAGRCDGGILIHELQLWDQHRDLKKIGDLGKLWEARYHLPLPLGGNAIRRSLGDQTISQLTTILRESIIYGFKHRESTLKSALRRSGASIDLQEADRYITMYVNDHSLDLMEPVKKSIDILLKGGSSLGLCPAVESPF